MVLQETKARVFIGSSSEGKRVAKKLKLALNNDFETTLWDQGVFDLSQSTLQSLVKASKKFDFAILVLSPDDKVTKRGKSRLAARDNVIFEIGLFIGSIGSARTLVVFCEDDKLILPTDLAGFTVATYKRYRNMQATVSKIKEAIIKVQATESSIHFDEAVFSWMYLSEGARNKLGRSKFIKIGGTRDALMMLVASAKEGYSILAICGYKGDYSKSYYKENFQKCEVVRRVFSYEAICSEFKTKEACYALEGLRMHRDKKATGRCDVEVFLIPKGKRIKDLKGGNFDPPLSFGLAILRDENKSPKMAVIHWEMDAEPLKHLIAIEGVIIDDGQNELLDELVKLHESITGSDIVLSSKKHSKTIATAYTELKEVWKSQNLAKKRGEG